ncbi:MAG: hypothetical protein COA32_14885 [Fluviicola sp.]|nr:MAG: hypothetical protein COA32_14885 [Fluviicola sp.]
MNTYLKKVLIYVLLKYVLFFVVLMIKQNNFELLEYDNIISGGTVQYIFFVLSIPVIISLIFTVGPIYFSFKSKNLLIIGFVLLLTLIFEYFMYVYGTSEKFFFDFNGLLLLIVSLVVFYFLFKKEINDLKF